MAREIDDFDRRMAGIDPAIRDEMGGAGRPNLRPDLASAYGPTITLDDLRRLFLRGQAPAAAPTQMALGSDALPGGPMPGPVERMTEIEVAPPAGAASAAPMIAPPVPPPAPRAAMAAGTRSTGQPPPPPPPAPMTAAPRPPGGFVPFATPSPLPGTPGPMTAAGLVPRPMLPAGVEVPGTLPGEAATAPVRLDPTQLARALQRFGRMNMDPASFAARFRAAVTQR